MLRAEQGLVDLAAAEGGHDGSIEISYFVVDGCDLLVDEC